MYIGTIPEHFAHIVSQHGDRPAVIARSPTPRASETILTYHMLDLLSNRLASSLASLGVAKGDRVAISLGNTVEFAALTYACYKLGAVLVPLNPGFQASQVEATLRHLGAGTLIIGAVTDLAYRPGRGRSNEALLGEVLAGHSMRGSGATIETDRVPTLNRVIVVDNRASHEGVRFALEECTALTPYTSLLEGSERGVKPSKGLDAHDTINIQFTSGTTSTPKAAMLTHHSILNNGIFIAHRMGLDPRDMMVVPPPLFHCFGCILGYMATATTGAAILFPSPAFDPIATLKMCVDHNATGLYGVSTMLSAVLDALDKDKDPAPAHLRKGIVAGSSVPESLMKTIYERLGLRDLVICYGMTETSPVSCMTAPSDPFHQRCSTVGTPLPHTSVKIVDPLDRARVVPLGMRGELAAAGYLVMKGYFGDEARTADVRVEEADSIPIHDGASRLSNTSTSTSTKEDDGPEKSIKTTTWLYSGDQATMDQHGFVTITGRLKDLIIRAGENIYPLEVENCLLQHPGVAQVSVVGVPDEQLGEAVAAFVILSRGWGTEAADVGAGAITVGKSQDGGGGGGDETARRGRTILTVQEVRDWVRGRLSSHLVPKHVFWVDEFPKTASGKVQKFVLREWVGRRGE
ncbi:hypothetical protein E4U56_000130 [Claviceps arundinis]|uniref:Uncharacterized protein n=1 Tax=Claviceps arundinis TaxID=1623583 RepID=A0A9P7N1B7_9HYPO|nr:hypothetical protein E4U56_000130 [Claviceps arundinis]